MERKRTASASQAVASGDVEGQANNDGSVQLLGGGSQNNVRALSLANIADSGANIGQNIAKVDAHAAGFAQVNLQKADVDVKAGQGVGTLVAAYQANNNGSVRLDDSQNGVEGISIANIADSGANIGQNIAKVDAYAAGFAQVNSQKADVDTVAGQGVGTLLAAYQTNNNGSVRLDDSQNGAEGVSIANIADSGANIGQNIAKVDAYATGFAQVNSQKADVDTVAGQGVGTLVAAYQTNNNGSVQLLGGGSQNNVRAVSLANIADSGANIGQNIAKVDAYAAGFAQVNKQKADVDTVAGQGVGTLLAAYQTNNNGSVRLDDSQNGAEGVSIANIADSGANIGQNIAKVDAFAAGFAQVNSQKADVDTVAGQGVGTLVAAYQTNNNGSVQLVGSQNNAKALSIANIADSGANIGQNIAKVDAHVAGFAQVNSQKADVDTVAGQLVLTGLAADQTNNNGSVQLVGSQNNAKALSIANIADSGANIGQNIAKVDPVSRVDVAQINTQYASVDATAEQIVAGDKVRQQTSNNGSVDLIGSQNGVSALSLVNAALSAVNVGQNIASITGSDVDVNQVNYQKAEADSYADQSVSFKGAKASQSNNSSVVLNNAQMNTSALVIANVAGSAVNIGQNIAYVTGARGIGVYQTNIQKAW